MLEYLKESTFIVNEVIKKAWQLTKEHYLSVAILCFLMFITSTASTLMALYMADVNVMLRVLMAAVFVLLFCTLYLSLTRYILHIIDYGHEEEVSIINTIPTKRQIISFLVAVVYFMICVGSIFLLAVLLPMPVIYVLDKMHVLTDSQTVNKIFNIFMPLGLVALFITWIRISFYPFFILDKGAKPFESIKLSLAVTKGNFIKIVILLVVMGAIQILYFTVGIKNFPITSTIINFLSCFIVVPLSAVALTVAYRKMVDERELEGDKDNSILHNIF